MKRKGIYYIMVEFMLPWRAQSLENHTVRFVALSSSLCKEMRLTTTLTFRQTKNVYQILFHPKLPDFNNPICPKDEPLFSSNHYNNKQFIILYFHLAL